MRQESASLHLWVASPQVQSHVCEWYIRLKLIGIGFIYMVKLPDWSSTFEQQPVKVHPDMHCQYTPCMSSFYPVLSRLRLITNEKKQLNQYSSSILAYLQDHTVAQFSLALYKLLYMLIRLIPQETVDNNQGPDRFLGPKALDPYYCRQPTL